MFLICFLVTFPTTPRTKATVKVDIVYTEVMRENI